MRRGDAATTMSPTLDAGAAEELVEQYYPTRHAVPESPPDGDYVVVDVTHFSTTVVELLERGADYVHVTDERGDEPAFKEANPEARIGGSSTDTYDPEPGYDFFNSPSAVHDVDVAGRPVAMTSTNGGQAVTDIRDAPGEQTVYVGTTTNAAALGRHLAARDRPLRLVAAGSKGAPSIPDTIGAILVGRYAVGDAPSAEECEALRELLQVSKGAKYRAKPTEVRTRDLVEFTSAIDSRDAVPRLEGTRLTDASAVGEENRRLAEQ